MENSDKINSGHKIDVNFSHNIHKNFFQFHQSSKFSPIVIPKTMKFIKSKFWKMDENISHSRKMKNKPITTQLLQKLNHKTMNFGSAMSKYVVSESEKK